MEPNSLNQADRHLLGLIRAGDVDGWNQFLGRYQRRLTAFAIGRVDQLATAEDLVQETFVAFLKSIDRFREQGSLESFLFRMLRRRIVDYYRASGQERKVPVCQIGTEPSAVNLDQVASSDLTASQYARLDEQLEEDQRTLSLAIVTITGELCRAEKFHELKIAEGLFYAGIRNRQLAELLGVSENEIAVIKHRLIKKLSRCVQTYQASLDPVQTIDGVVAPELRDADLRAAWETHRPSCPKRSTLGKYTLGILSPAWHDFVRYHVETLGCLFCDANLAEFRKLPPTAPSTINNHLFQSTVGFLPPPNGNST
ncbi:RNA polymerase sigma factor [Novipirellula aureliae]|uniref:RNA polymerase sigma factor n=1 Tax=Novipirellula aureliae TaxID=2527966 RepID=A0A5C6DI49_9BACT|nr:sigma-70 family RNA polymerase sigma factor [Novipirellula aureliae]TWU34579.1 RNA polymerase sigma factor [Novipirellula aureliae]